jgi:hypothetical protein
MSMKKSLRLTALLICPVLFLSLGCLRNSPTSVAKRFILSIKNLKWDTMVKMVDWDTTQRTYGGGIPQGSKRDLVYTFAAKFTRNRFEDMTDEEIKHKFLYLAVRSTESIEKSDRKARVKVVCQIEKDQDDRSILIDLTKVEREWKVVLRPDMFEYGR